MFYLQDVWVCRDGQHVCHFIFSLHVCELSFNKSSSCIKTRSESQLKSVGWDLEVSHYPNFHLHSEIYWSFDLFGVVLPVIHFQSVVWGSERVGFVTQRDDWFESKEGLEKSKQAGWTKRSSVWVCVRSLSTLMWWFAHGN